MSHRPAINVLWFKRDLRLRDHAPLQAAIATGKPLLLLYCFEPSVMADPNYDMRHWRFVAECLADLNRQLPKLMQTTVAPQVRTHEWLPFVFDDEPVEATSEAVTGQPRVWVFQRDVLEVLGTLHQLFTIDTLFSHEETGLKVTYDRDKAIARHCREQAISWQEFQCNGVIRRLKNRDTWADDWQKTMRAPQQHPDLARWRPANVPDDWFEAERGPDLPASWHVPDSLFQPGGEQNAFRYLDSFLTERIAHYAKSISKPLESRRGCSRVSPYIAWGCLSIRQVFQAQLLTAKNPPQPGLGRQFSAFASRLRWHCHFIQKFESEDRIEFENVNRAFDALTKNQNPAHYAAWHDGKTGYPMIDACMRCLTATGYINFRMRAMLTSFLSHHLLQHWKEGALHLARIYTDFEPGIHYAQIQMQAGMTGTNTVRIYNPVKQSQEHDPTGVFIKQWIPELANCPVAYIHEPWTMPPLEQNMAHFHVGLDYPAPIIDITQTGREARIKLHEPRKTEAAKTEKERILKRHTIPGTHPAAKS
ncbi:cryptochrome/deoxyribodipyrimidine photo-lyase family protein [Fibrivirga algicola]|uniref:Deoxyribodipyrimidine photo-lyase n=1 Tax=Fibrivirga algicola TaxID=2950420 RepID=A0ABX0QJZ4_9BACT|nr:deoxyribodipyrimidine photo-lyase [Fibrivirga algicola]NID12604.1 deoxyribodipyrimidine photo-lyase [Fibrivirga algicola]